MKPKPQPHPAPGSDPDPNASTTPDPSVPEAEETAPVEPPPPPEYQMVGPPCRFLRNKGMYVYTDGVDDGHADYDNTIFWCLRTQKGFGPDNDEVHRELCSDPSRSCHEAL